MANCDYCGKFFRGGSLQRGQYQFCNSACLVRGKVLSLLDNYSTTKIDSHIASLRTGKCKECGSSANIDFHKSYSVYSLIFYTSWKTVTHFCCKKCGRRHQVEAALYSFVLGWWGIPFGFFVTPWQIGRNVIGMLRTDDRPSDDLKRFARLKLADKLAAGSENESNGAF